MNHKRVIPRDFFNEAKLLKCLGQLQLLIHDKNDLNFTVEFDSEPFVIVQNDSDGSLSVLNYRLYFDGTEVELFTLYNSKDAYPLWFRYKGHEDLMLDDHGRLIFNPKGES